MFMESSPAGQIAERADIHCDIRQPVLHSGHVSLDALLKTCVKLGGSDLHLEEGSVPMIRRDGVARFMDCAPPTAAAMTEYVDQILSAQGKPEERRDTLKQQGTVDMAYLLPGVARFRTNVFHSRGKYAVVMRRIIVKIPTFEELNLPRQVQDLADNERGIVIVSGTTGSGKSTTLAAIIGKINHTRSERIITVEDPVEYQHENARSFISQVEVGTDNVSYECALRAMMRQDPDTILIGEMRDPFSVTTALRAADTGHLVFTTVHATNAAMTIERVVSLFDPLQRELQQTQLGLNLIAVVCQRLAKRRDGKGRVPIVEIMQATPLVRKYILDGEFEKLKGMVGNKDAGCQSFDQHLTELFHQQIIDLHEAKRLATNVEALSLALRGISNSETRLR